MINAQATFRVEMQFSAGIWTNVIADVIVEDRFEWSRGSTGHGPTDKMAQPGLFEFALCNDARNSGAKQSYYSPGHANCRSGFARGIPVRLIGRYLSTDYPVWRGRLRTILPEPGVHRSRRTHCTAQDIVADLVEAQVRGIPPQVDQTEDQLIQAVLDALPSTAQPAATSLDVGLDVVPYAYDNIGAGVSAWQAIADAVVSAFGWGYSLGDGTLAYENRHTRALKSSVATFTDTNGADLSAPSAIDDAYNRARVTYHPKDVDAAATTVLYEAPSPIEVPPLQTVTIWGTYRDPSNTVRLIGGTDVDDGTLGFTDYVANSLEDGSGSDLRGDVAVLATGFASNVMFEITNANSSQTAFVTPQLRGKGIYDNAPITVEKYITEDYGDRPVDIDLPFQDQGTIAQDLADYVANIYADRQVVERYVLNANRSDTDLVQALDRDIGDVITLSETVTGVSAMAVAIQGVNGSVQNGKWFVMSWALVPQDDSSVFVFDDAVLGLFDSGILGYA